MDKLVGPDVGKSQKVKMAETSSREGRTGSFLGSEIMPAVTVTIPMPQGAAAPAQAAPKGAQAAPKAAPQAALTRRTADSPVSEVLADRSSRNR
jgi:hypothetical protein